MKLKKEKKKRHFGIRKQTTAICWSYTLSISKSIKNVNSKDVTLSKWS